MLCLSPANVAVAAVAAAAINAAADCDSWEGVLAWGDVFGLGSVLARGVTLEGELSSAVSAVVKVLGGDVGLRLLTARRSAGRWCVTARFVGATGASGSVEGPRSSLRRGHLLIGSL